jgi:hypothetical protein
VFHETAINDIDIYARSAKAMILIKDYIINSKKNIKTFATYSIDPATGDKLVTQGANPAITVNAVTLTNDVQFIYMDTWDNCKSKFDFIHCQPHYDLATQKYFISKAQYDSIKSKELVTTGLVEIKENRRDKYLKRGWKEQFKSAEFKSNDIGEIGIIAQEISQIIPSVIK